MLDKVDMMKVAERIEKEGVENAAHLCYGFLQSLASISKDYLDKVKSLMHTYKDEVCMMDTCVSLSVVSYKSIILQSLVGCDTQAARKLLIAELKEQEEKHGSN